MTYFIPQTAKDKPIRGLDRPFLLSVQNAQALAASLIILLLSHGMVVWSLEFALVMSLSLNQRLPPSSTGWNFLKECQQKSLYGGVKANEKMETLSNSLINYVCESARDIQ